MNEGIAVVDTGRFLSQAQYALKEIRASSNKPIIGILITHPHTDHYGGLPVFVEAAGVDVPIYASQITADDIRTDRQGFIRARNELHGNDFPDHNEIPLPNQIVEDGEEIRLGTLTIQVIELPKNETIVTTLYYLPEQSALFAGDIVTNKTTPFLSDGYSGNWTAQLRMLLERYPFQTVYHGHGKPGSAEELIPAQIEYIETLRDRVANALTSSGKVTSEEKEAILAEMEERYPDYQTSLLLPGLLERGIDGIAEELKRENG
jgi:glyoxylase-like metal-dependent hydrolase (beta-lactamase superfamily II)